MRKLVIPEYTRATGRSVPRGADTFSRSPSYGYRARRGPRTERVEALGAPLEARLDELTRSVDAIAVEVKRIGEAQRYLMLERRSPSSLSDGRSSQGRSITPH